MRPGFIKSVVLENFLTHENFRLDFTKQITFIHGRNGSGKSSILQGIRFGLGGTPSSIREGVTDLEQLIRRPGPGLPPPTQARVVVSIANEGEGALHPDLLGTTIVIERKLTRSQTGKVSSTMHVTSLKDKQLSRASSRARQARNCLEPELAREIGEEARNLATMKRFIAKNGSKEGLAARICEYFHIYPDNALQLASQEDMKSLATDASQLYRLVGQSLGVYTEVHTYYDARDKCITILTDITGLKRKIKLEEDTKKRVTSALRSSGDYRVKAALNRIAVALKAAIPVQAQIQRAKSEELAAQTEQAAAEQAAANAAQTEADTQKLVAELSDIRTRAERGREELQCATEDVRSAETRVRATRQEIEAGKLSTERILLAERARLARAKLDHEQAEQKLRSLEAEMNAPEPVLRLLDPVPRDELPVLRERIAELRDKQVMVERSQEKQTELSNEIYQLEQRIRDEQKSTGQVDVLALLPNYIKTAATEVRRNLNYQADQHLRSRVLCPVDASVHARTSEVEPEYRTDVRRVLRFALQNQLQSFVCSQQFAPRVRAAGARNVTSYHEADCARPMQVSPPLPLVAQLESATGLKFYRFLDLLGYTGEAATLAQNHLLEAGNIEYNYVVVGPNSNQIDFKIREALRNYGRQNSQPCRLRIFMTSGRSFSLQDGQLDIKGADTSRTSPMREEHVTREVIVQELKEQLARLKSELRDRQTDRNEVQRIKAEILTATRELGDLERRIREVDTRNRELSAQHDLAIQKYEGRAQQADIDAQAERVAELAAVVDKCEAESLSQLPGMSPELEAAHEAAKAELQAAQQRQVALSESQETFKTEERTKLAAITTAGDDVSRYKQEHEIHMDSYREHAEEADNLVADIDRMNKESFETMIAPCLYRFLVIGDSQMPETLPGTIDEHINQLSHILKPLEQFYNEDDDENLVERLTSILKSHDSTSGVSEIDDESSDTWVRRVTRSLHGLITLYLINKSHSEFEGLVALTDTVDKITKDFAVYKGSIDDFTTRQAEFHSICANLAVLKQQLEKKQEELSNQETVCANIVKRLSVTQTKKLLDRFVNDVFPAYADELYATAAGIPASSRVGDDAQIRGLLRHHEIHKFTVPRLYKVSRTPYSADDILSKQRAFIKIVQNNRELKTSELSGGERTTLALALIISVWISYETTVGGIDEWDVFTDAARRDLLIRAILNPIVIESGMQFILISPNAVNIEMLDDDTRNLVEAKTL